MPTHNLSSEQMFGQLDNRLKLIGAHGFRSVSENLTIAASQDVAFLKDDWSQREFRRKKKAVDELQIKWRKAQKDLRNRKTLFSDDDNHLITEARKKINLRKQLDKYGGAPTSAEDIDKLASHVDGDELNKALQLLVRNAKNDFKTLKTNHRLFKQ